MFRKLMSSFDFREQIAGANVDNNTSVYFNEISEQTGIVCYTTNFNVSCEANNSQVYVIGDWYFPNGEHLPAKQMSSISTLFAVRNPATGMAHLQRLGHPSQTGRYFCAAPITDKFYVHISEICDNSYKHKLISDFFQANYVKN